VTDLREGCALRDEKMKVGKVIGAFVIVCALLTALLLVL
jgi:hypothetical protein